jgi:hypothetical protein
MEQIDFCSINLFKKGESMNTLIETKSSANDLHMKIKEHLEELARATDEARISEETVRYLDFCAKFHHYSPSNIWLILMTRPDASFVAGFNAWKKMGRYVKRGEKGIPILAPMFYREDPDDEDKVKVLRGFRVVYVFDVIQTDGQPLPDPPNWKSPEKNLELQKKLMEFAEQNAIQVTIKELDGETQGISTGGSIVLSPEAGIKTLIHEIAHELLHQVDYIHLTRAEKEMEAEAVGYIVSRHFGIDELASANYLSLVGVSSDMIYSSLEKVQKCASLIINHIQQDDH